MRATAIGGVVYARIRRKSMRQWTRLPSKWKPLPEFRKSMELLKYHAFLYVDFLVRNNL